MKVSKASPAAKNLPPVSPNSNQKQPDKNSLGRRAGWALIWNIAFLPLKAGLSLFVALVIVKLFPRDRYVVLATITAIQSTLGLFVDLGIERALPRFVGQIEKQLGRGALRRFIVTVTIVKLAVLAVLISLMALLSDSFIRWFNLSDNGPLYLSMVAVLLVLGALYDICTNVLYSFFKQKVTNLLDIVVTVLNPLLTLALIIWPFHLEVYGVILALLITTVISVVIAGWQAFLAGREAAEIAQRERELSQVNSLKAASTSLDSQPVAEHGSLPGEDATDPSEEAQAHPVRSGQPLEKAPAEATSRSESLWRRFTKYAALMYFFNISAWFYDASFAILVFQFYREFLTVALVRLIYSFIKQLLKTLLAPFAGVQTPLFSSIHAEGNHAQLQAAYNSLSKLQAFILVPSAIGAIVVARNLTELMFLRTSQDAVLTRTDLNLAVWATVLTILFTFTEAIISIPMTVLQVYEHYRLVVLSRVLPLLVGPLLVMAAFLHWNVIVAVCLMGSMAVGSRIFALVALQRVLHLSYPLKFFWKVSRASLAFGVPLLAVIFFLPASWPVTFVVAGLGVVIFVAVFRKLGGFDPEDKNRLLSLKLPFRKYIIKWL
ncbi:MAG TPA: oligosaccharide flippase family protein [Chloroflexia bacterium]|nr:oligosaccharide flippase family protein [Chloroflexia bacterium]